MKAIGRNLIILKEKQGTTETKGGLLLAEKQREDIRYAKAKVISTGDEVQGIKDNDIIYYDRHAGHSIDFEGDIYNVIKLQDVVIVV
jgi:co-chaperonin GroES (HSP10)